MSEEKTTVAIIGAGVAGLALANFLLHEQISCIVLEKRSRAYVEQRQRAGVIDPWAVRMFRTRGLEERVVGGLPSVPTLNFRIDGESRSLALDPADHADGRFCPQRVLLKNLMDAFIADGGDLRFDADVSLDGLVVRSGGRTIDCALIAGCDGDRGISRAAIPRDHLTRHEHEYGYAWLTILAEVAPRHQSLMAIHARGFAGQFARGPQASRFYLQCPLDSPEWTDEQIWCELEARFGEPMPRGRIASTQLVPIRSVVYSPMSYGRLYLLGDAAHIIPPMSAKGMNLALHDADVFANAVGDPQRLTNYSDSCLRHVWNYQAYAASWTDLIHDAGDPSYRGEYRHQLARADLERLFTSDAAKRLLSQFLAGSLPPYSVPPSTGESGDTRATTSVSA